MMKNKHTHGDAIIRDNTLYLFLISVTENLMSSSASSSGADNWGVNKL